MRREVSCQEHHIGKVLVEDQEVKHRLEGLNWDVTVAGTPFTSRDIAGLSWHSAVSSAAQVFFTVGKRTWKVIEIEVDIGQVHRFQSWPHVLVLGHHVIQVLNIVIVLNIGRLCGQDIVTDGS